MHLGFHGGKCCGIKTIHSLGCKPKEMMGGGCDCEECRKDDSSVLDKIKADNSDQFGKDVRSDQRFFADAAPKETYKERLKRYIDYCKATRPKGAIEITLVVGGAYSQADWIPILKEHGFEEVVRFKNSNSGNTVGVFYLTYGQDGGGFNVFF